MSRVVIAGKCKTVPGPNCTLCLQRYTEEWKYIHEWWISAADGSLWVSVMLRTIYYQWRNPL